MIPIFSTLTPGFLADFLLSDPYVILRFLFFLGARALMPCAIPLVPLCMHNGLTTGSVQAIDHAVGILAVVVPRSRHTPLHFRGQRTLRCFCFSFTLSIAGACFFLISVIGDICVQARREGIGQGSVQRYPRFSIDRNWRISLATPRSGAPPIGSLSTDGRRGKARQAAM